MHICKYNRGVAQAQASSINMGMRLILNGFLIYSYGIVAKNLEILLITAVILI